MYFKKVCLLFGQVARRYIVWVFQGDISFCPASLRPPEFFVYTNNNNPFPSRLKCLSLKSLSSLVYCKYGHSLHEWMTSLLAFYPQILD
jgi:hypothetical protein